MKVVFVRHGLTPWNEAKRIQGSTPYVELSPSGVEQAINARDGLIKAGFKFTKIFSSPLRRAVQTAEIFAEQFPLPIITDSRIKEFDFGDYEGSEYGEGLYKDANLRNCFAAPELFIPCGGESYESFNNRVQLFLDFLKTIENDLDTVLCVCHGGVMHAITHLTDGVELHDYWREKQPNACAHILDLKNGEFKMIHRSIIFTR